MKKPENTLSFFCACKVVRRVWYVILVSTYGRNSIRADQEVRLAGSLERNRFFSLRCTLHGPLHLLWRMCLPAASPRDSVRGTSHAWRVSKARGTIRHSAELKLSQAKGQFGFSKGQRGPARQQELEKRLSWVDRLLHSLGILQVV